MESTVERRGDECGRVPMSIPVELGQADFDEAFEADGVDLSVGGLALRSTCLPDIGTQLLCRFEPVAGGTKVDARAEVVWASLEGERSGEFGVRFVDMDACSRALVEEMVAEHERAVGGGFAAKLELDGSPAPIEVRIETSDEGSATFVQPLELLQLGRGVWAQQLGKMGRRGEICGVDVRLDGDTPTLAVRVRFRDGERSWGEYSLGATDPAALTGAEPAEDTTPDLQAPSKPATPAGAVAVRSEITVTEFSPPREEVESALDLDAPQPPPARSEGKGVEHPVAARSSSSLPAALQDSSHVSGCDGSVNSAADTFSPWKERTTDGLQAPRADGDDLAGESQPERSSVETVPPVSASTASGAPSRHGLGAAAPEPVDGPVDRASQAGAEIGADPTSEPDALMDAPSFAPTASLPPWASALAQQVGRLRGRATQLTRGLSPQLRAGATELGKQLTRGVAALPTASRARPGLAMLLRRRRRTTAPRPAAASPKRIAGARGQRTPPARRGLLRPLAILTLGVGAVALGVYAFAPHPAEDAIVLHRQVELEAPSTAPAPVPTAQALAVAQGPAAPAEAPAGATKQGLPENSPYAIDLDVPPEELAKVGRASGKVFGAAEVANARRFTLRMSMPIKQIKGTPDKGGFSVTIPGSLSLDRAGPIASAHRRVRRSMILNKGDHSELTIRFAEGESPTYRVKAEGDTLVILIES